MSLIIQIKVVPSSGQQKIILDKAGIIKCYLKNAPEKRKANKELITMLAEKLSCQKNNIEIIAGLTSRNKKIKITIALTYDEFMQKLGLYTGNKNYLYEKILDLMITKKIE